MPFEPQRIGGKLSPLVMPRYAKRHDEHDAEFDAAVDWLKRNAKRRVVTFGVEYLINEVVVAVAYTSSGVYNLNIYADKP